MDENRLEQLITQAKKGSFKNDHTLDADSPEKELLVILSELGSMPASTPPLPQIRRKYLSHKTAWSWHKNFVFIKTFNFIPALAIFAGLLLAGGFTYATANSLPGQKLFEIKKSAEQFRVKFTGDKIQRAYLQVQIAKKRVSEAQHLASLPGDNLNRTLAAIKEASKATEMAAEEVNTLPRDSISSANPELINSLEEVGKKEQALVSDIAEKDAAKDVIALSLKNQTRISEIKQSVEITTAEEALATLLGPEDSVTLSGQITKIEKGSLQVEKTAFEVNASTTLVSAEGVSLVLSDLKPGEKVAVTGKKLGNKIVALKLSAIGHTEDSTPAAASSSPESAKLPENTSTPDTLLKHQEPAREESEEEPKNDPNNAVGGFIIEDPLPQYVK